MRIGILTGSLSGGGAEHVARAWAGGLRDRGHDVTVLTYEGPRPDVRLDGITQAHRDAATLPDRWLRLPGWVRRVTRAQRLEVLVGVMDFSNLVVLAAVAGLGRHRPATVLNEQNVMSVYLRQQGPRGIAKRALARRSYRLADAAVACSHAVATDLVVRCGVPAQRVFVVPNPVGLTAAADNRGDRHTDGPLRIAFAGRLVPQKRPERVLETLEELQRRGIPAAARFIGDGPDRAALAQQAARTGLDVEFTGWVDDWRREAADADCLLLPSDVEGLGIVLMEAAAVGLPAVAPSQALGTADALVPGVTGVPALSTAPEHLADAVLAASRLRADGDGQLVDRGWLDWYGVDNSVERLQEVLVTAVGRRRPQ